MNKILNQIYIKLHALELSKDYNLTIFEQELLRVLNIDGNTDGRNLKTTEESY